MDDQRALTTETKATSSDEGEWRKANDRWMALIERGTAQLVGRDRHGL